MPSSLLRPRWVAAMLAVAVVATGGLAYAAIPDAGGVIHSCYTKSSGAWRVIDTDAGQACKTNEAALDLYSKGAADLTFLTRNGKAADSDKLDGQDSSAFLGSGAKAADSDKLDGQDSSAFLTTTSKAADADKLDGRDSFHYLKGFDARILTDFVRVGDNVTWHLGHQAEGVYPGMLFDLACDPDGGTTLTVSSSQQFTWWWDESFGHTASTPPFQHTFLIGNGVEKHTFRGMHDVAWYTTTLDLDTSIGVDPLVRSNTCVAAWTLLKAQNDSPGP